MTRKAPSGPHAEVAERFAFLLDALDLDREGFVAAVDGAVTARSLFAILAGDRRPSRSLAVLIERTFGFRAEHLLDGTGPMWAAPATADHRVAGLTHDEQRVLDFARRSVDNARLLAEELAQAEAWEALWARAMRLLTDLEHLARRDDPSDYPVAATAVLEECWRMADTFGAWTAARHERRVLHLTRLFVQRFLIQVPKELRVRGRLTAPSAAAVADRAQELLAALDVDVTEVDGQIDRAVGRIERLTTPPAGPTIDDDLGARLGALLDRIDRLRPLAGASAGPVGR